MPKSPEQIKRLAEKVVDNGGSTSLAQLEATIELADKLEDMKEMMSDKPEQEVQKVELVQGEQDEMATAFFSMLKGKKGDKGDTGEQGEKGEAGEQGIQGEKGEKGDKGDKGKDGQDGIDGLDGQDGKDGIDGKDGSPDNREQIVEKINSGDEESTKISITQIETGFALLKDIENLSNNIQTRFNNIRIPKGGGGSGGIEVLSNGVTVGKGSALNFIGATVTNTDGHTTTITVTGGGGSIGGTITGGTEGSVLFLGAGGVLAQDNSNFFWDDTNNRLGIGTTSPAYKLDVQGDIGLGATSATTAHLYMNSTTRNQIIAANGSSLEFWDGATENARFDANGNFGIGTTSPGAKLDVAGDTIIKGGGLTTLSPLSPLIESPLSPLSPLGPGTVESLPSLPLIFIISAPKSSTFCISGFSTSFSLRSVIALVMSS